MIKLLIIQRYESEARDASLAVRCHAGTLRVADVITSAVDPDGIGHAVALTCNRIKLNRELAVDELDVNYGGLITVSGDGVDLIGADWVLSSA